MRGQGGFDAKFERVTTCAQSVHNLCTGLVHVWNWSWAACPAPRPLKKARFGCVLVAFHYLGFVGDRTKVTERVLHGKKLGGCCSVGLNFETHWQLGGAVQFVVAQNAGRHAGAFSSDVEGLLGDAVVWSIIEGTGA